MTNPSMSNNNSTQSIATSVTAASGDGGGGSTSPESRVRSLPALWTQVVRGDLEPSSSQSAIAAPVSPLSSSSPPSSAVTASPAPLPEQASESVPSSDSSGATPQGESSVENGGGNAAPPKRSAWNRPSNGVVEPISVMGGAISWPALSESTRSGPRSTQDSARSISNGSSSASQEGSIGNQLPQRQVNTNMNGMNANASTNSNSNANHRQRGVRHRGGGGGGGSGGGYSNNHNGGGGGRGFVRPPPTPLPPPFPVVEIPYMNVIMDSSIGGARVRSQPSRRGGGHYNPRPHHNNNHHHHRRDQEGGSGSYHNHHHNHNRREQDRRDGGNIHMQYNGYMGPPPPPPGTPPPPPPPYGPPLAIRPYNPTVPMGYDMSHPLIYVQTYAPPSEQYRGVPIIAQGPSQPPPLPPMLYPVVEPTLIASVIKQVDYYFSDHNLVKDMYLRNNMDDEGWVPISIIVNFPRLAKLTTNIEFILECLKGSHTVDIKGEKIRRRGEWMRFLRIPRHNNGGEGAAIINNNVILGEAVNGEAA